MSKPQSSLASLVRDTNKEPVQIGSSFITNDASASPKVSPLAYSSSVITLAVPDGAVELILFPSTDLRVSEVVGMAQYDVIASASKEAIGCARMTNIYITRDSADGSLRFRWTII